MANPFYSPNELNRRTFLHRGGIGLGSLAVASLLQEDGFAVAPKKDAGVACCGTEPHAITEECTARALTRRVDGENADGAILFPQPGHDRIEQGRLAGARCAGHSDPRTATATLEAIE